MKGLNLPPMKKAVIFDLDGTLADTLTTIAYFANQALEASGFQAISKEKYRSCYERFDKPGRCIFCT